MRPRTVGLLAAAATPLAVAVLTVSIGRAQHAPPGRAGISRELRLPSAFARIGDMASRSAALFTEAGKVLQHPRCLNCHPDGDRPSQGTGFPHQPPVQRGADGLGVATMRCSTCHQTANYDPGRVPGHPDWRLAPSSMGWAAQNARGDLRTAEGSRAER